MFSNNDKLLMVLHSCYDTLQTERLPYYIYIFQNIGVDFSFRYRFGASKFASKSLNEYVNSLINGGYILIGDKGFEVTEFGKQAYLGVVLTLDEWDFLDWLKSVLDELSDMELYFICLVEMFISESYNRGGHNALIKDEKSIRQSLQNLSHEYSDENFEAALKILRMVRNRKRV